MDTTSTPHPEAPTPMLPPGDYLIIDPCYILARPRFLTLMNAVWAAGAPVVMTDPQTGALFAWSSTATGDGVYADQEGQQYGVDSGALACLPLVMVDAVQLATRPVHDKSEGAGLLWPPGHLPGAEPVSPLR